MALTVVTFNGKPFHLKVKFIPHHLRIWWNLICILAPQANIFWLFLIQGIKITVHQCKKKCVCVCVRLSLRSAWVGRFLMLYIVKPKNMCCVQLLLQNLFQCPEFLWSQNYFLHTLRGYVADSFRQIPAAAFLHLNSEVDNIWPLTILKLYKLWRIFIDVQKGNLVSFTVSTGKFLEVHYQWSF
jgi:hypothetical protein